MYQDGNYLYPGQYSQTICRSQIGWYGLLGWSILMARPSTFLESRLWWDQDCGKHQLNVYVACCCPAGQVKLWDSRSGNNYLFPEGCVVAGNLYLFGRLGEPHLIMTKLALLWSIACVRILNLMELPVPITNFQNFIGIFIIKCVKVARFICLQKSIKPTSRTFFHILVITKYLHLILKIGMGCLNLAGQQRSLRQFLKGGCGFREITFLE